MSEPFFDKLTANRLVNFSTIKFIEVVSAGQTIKVFFIDGTSDTYTFQSLSQNFKDFVNGKIGDPKLTI